LDPAQPVKKTATTENRLAQRRARIGRT